LDSISLLRSKQQDVVANIMANAIMIMIDMRAYDLIIVILFLHFFNLIPALFIITPVYDLRVPRASSCSKIVGSFFLAIFSL